MQGTEPGLESNGQDDIENDFEEYEELANNPAALSNLSKGWTAYIVAVVPAATLWQ